MDFAKGNAEAEPPRELRVHWMCQRYPGALPEQGGVYDQSAELMYRMGVFANIHDTVSRLRNLKGEQIHGLSNGERRVLRSLIDNGINPFGS